jgi:cytochrome d ubiquinol oxidase subunit I
MPGSTSFVVDPAAGSDLLFARGQMATSLAFHIVFASIGIAMPVLMLLAELRWRRRGDAVDRALARRWSKGTAIFFAVGAVSGTVLSFELGLLFPGFMHRAGALIGMPFSLEGFAFFTEAIFLGLYLYGRDRLPPWLHVGSAAMVALSGLLSAVFVLLANAWMNAPTGFWIGDGGRLDGDPVAAMRSPAALHEIVHMVVAAYLVTGFGVAAIHAAALLRRPASPFHRRALQIALLVAVPAALVEPFVGHFAAQRVAILQPMKLAACEQLQATQPRAPLHLGPLRVPGLLSWLAHGDVDAVVHGLEEVAPEDRPPPIVRPAFLAMVGIGSLLALLAVVVALRAALRRDLAAQRALLIALIAAGPLAVVALEAGWVVTECGRQPWVIQGVLRTAEAVTPMPGLVVPFAVFTLVYLALSVALGVILFRDARASIEEAA